MDFKKARETAIEYAANETKNENLKHDSTSREYAVKDFMSGVTWAAGQESKPDAIDFLEWANKNEWFNTGTLENGIHYWVRKGDPTTAMALTTSQLYQQFKF